MAKLNLKPDETNYAIQDGSDVLIVITQGGPPRVRKDIENSNVIVSAKWTLDPTEFNEISTFYKEIINNGRDLFTIDLEIEGAPLVEHSAVFIPGTFKISNITGLTHTVEAQLEVTPILQPIGYYEMIVLDQEGADITGALQGLEDFSNSTFW